MASIAYGVSEYPNAFERQAAFALDNSSVFYSMDDAVEYAAHSDIAYQGQIISIVDKVNSSVTVTVLNKSNITGYNFELVNITGYIDKIDNKVGTWSLTNETSSNDGTSLTSDFNWDLFYPIDANKHGLVFGEDIISAQKNISEQITVDPQLFNNDNYKDKMYLMLANVDGEIMLELKLLIKYSDKYITIGDLIINN